MSQPCVSLVRRAALALLAASALCLLSCGAGPQGTTPSSAPTAAAKPALERGAAAPILRGQEDLARIDVSLASARRRVVRARRERDLVALDCTQRKVSRIESCRSLALRAARARTIDAAQGEHERAKIRIAKDRALVLEVDAETCGARLPRELRMPR